MMVDLNDDDDDDVEERKFHETALSGLAGGGAGAVSSVTTPSFSFGGSSLDPYSLFGAAGLGNTAASSLYGGMGNCLASSSIMSSASGDSTPMMPDSLKNWSFPGLQSQQSMAVTENVPPNGATTATTAGRPPRRASSRKRKTVAVVAKAPATATIAAPQPKSDSTTIVEIDSTTVPGSSSEANNDDGRYFQALGPLRFAFIGEWSLILDTPTSTTTTAPAAAATPAEAVPNMSLLNPLLYLSFMQSSSQQQHPQLPAALALQGLLSAGTTSTGSITSVLRWGSPHMFENSRSGSGSGGGYRARRNSAAAAVSRSDPKVLYPEFLAYQLNLPVTRSSSILVRVQETRLDLLRALITGTRDK
jgi:hypothetical protein